FVPHLDTFCDEFLALGFFFFFQAEDGIRDKLVTGVQTCALPICTAASRPSAARASISRRKVVMPRYSPLGSRVRSSRTLVPTTRSEERRVGKECRSRWWRYD